MSASAAAASALKKKAAKPRPAPLRLVWSNVEQALRSFNAVVLPWLLKVFAAGERARLVVQTCEQFKSEQQRSFLYGVVLHEIAEQVVVHGRKYSLGTWKEHFRAEFLGSKPEARLNPFTGEWTQEEVRVSTEGLSVSRYSEYIERVMAYAATELGVAFPLLRWEDHEPNGWMP